MENLNRKLNTMDRRSTYGTRKRGKLWARLVVILLILLVVIYLPARGVYGSFKALSRESKALSASFKSENLDGMRAHLKNMKEASVSLNHSLDFLIWLQIIPFLGGYYGDARHFSSALTHDLSAASTITDGLDPYKNELGFTGVPTPGQDKIAQLVKILDKVIPNLDRVTPELKAASDDVSGIDTAKYPDKVGSRNVRTLIETARNFIIGAGLATTQYKSALQIAPSALGEPASKTYLILFQNDKELRATGGFMTAFAYLKLDHGHVSSTTSDDIYRLDEKLLNVCKSKICPLTPPAPIVKYLPEANGKPRTAWSMRDSNLSPDLPSSMKTFEGMYSLLGEGLPFDGIITIDTEVVRQMISITGPVQVFGTNYSADVDKRCSCPNVIYELENYSEIVAKGQTDRKAILGALMQQILAKALQSSSEKMPEFINAMATLASGKHLMFYMHDNNTEQALDQLNWTGKIMNSNGDYLSINDSNFAGGKSNLYLKEEVTLEIDKNSGNHKLTINYSNPVAYTTWLNQINRDYVRVYLPEGSTLTSQKGADEAVVPQKDLGKTYFETFLSIRPQNSRTLVINYTPPKGDYGNPYQILIQKQPGTQDFKYTIKVDGKTKTFNLSTDQDLKL